MTFTASNAETTSSPSGSVSADAHSRETAQRRAIQQTPSPQLRSEAVEARLADTALMPPLPRFAQIEPIGRCNLACRMCTVNDRGDTVGEMSLEEFRLLLDQMPDLEELHLQGLGEPMLHPQFFEMVKLAASRGIRVSANTNATLITPDRARRCVESGLAELSVSLDGASAAVYEAVRLKARFAKVMRNIDRLVAARKAAQSPLDIRAVMVLMRSNLPEIPDLIELLHAHGIDTLLVQRLSNDLAQPEVPERYIPIRTYVEAQELRHADLTHAQNIFHQARELAKQLGVTLHLPKLEPATTTGRCSWPSEQLYITAAGELLPCCMVATADRATFGNVLPAQKEGPKLIERWHGEAAQDFRAALSSDSPPAVCRGCALYRGTF